MKYTIIKGADAIDSSDVKRLLKDTYWAEQRSLEQIEQSMNNSSCYGLYCEEKQKMVGFSRVISDLATTFYLCDVIIDPDYQRQGLGTALVSYILSQPEYDGLCGLLLTSDACKLYEKFGFKIVDGKAMIKAPKH